MELHSQTAAKKFWDYLRAVLFMIKVKSVISKRKLILDAGLFMKRSRFLGKSISNLITRAHHNAHHDIKNPSSLNRYVFSCDNSPNPLCFNGQRTHDKRGYCLCLNAPPVEEGEEEEADMRTPLRLEYDSSQELRGLTSVGALSPFDVRVSDFSTLEGEGSSGGNGGVDSKAEEFIKGFYEQLRRQREIGLLEYGDE